VDNDWLFKNGFIHGLAFITLGFKYFALWKPS
jgi:hypothetical protein